MNARLAFHAVAAARIMRASGAETPQMAVSRGDSATMARTPTDGDATDQRAGQLQ